MTHPQPQLLVVDDNPARRLHLSALLAQAGYNVQAVADAALALSLTRAKPPDLLVAAAAVGLGVCQAVRGEAATQDIPVVIVGQLDSDDGAQERQAALAAGADEFVSMPLVRESFLELLAQLLHIRDVKRHLVL